MALWGLPAPFWKRRRCVVPGAGSAAAHAKPLLKDLDLLRMGLAAAAIRGSGPDSRDFWMALAELYVSAEEAGIDPRSEFETAGGGVPSNFHTYAVLKSRQRERKH